jgi:hypothetical protein
VYDLARTAGTVTFSSIRVALPAVDPSKPPPGYPVPAAGAARRATLRIGGVAGLARARARTLVVRVSALGGTVRNVVVTVRGRRGHLEGRGRPLTFAGSRRIAVRLRRALPAGRYAIEVTGRRADGSPVRASRWALHPVTRAHG